MKVLLIGANCQGNGIAELIKRNPYISTNFKVIVKPNYSEFVTETEELNRLFPTVDIYVYQPISSERFHYNIDFLKKNLLKKDCVLISFPVLYFTGYWPDFSSRKAGLSNKMLPYVHNKLEDLSHKYGRDNPEEIIKAARDPCLFSKEECIKNMEDTLAELRRREETIDIKSSDFIEQNYFKERLFHTVNHPSNKLLLFVTNKILERMGLNPIQEVGMAEYLAGHQMLIYPSVMNHLGLQFIEENSLIDFCSNHLYKNEFGDCPNRVSIEEYIRQFIRIFYTSLDNT